MTLGFAAAAWDQNGNRDVFVAADTRISSVGGVGQVDAGLKTYELGARCAMVAAGLALPPITAAELTRSLVTGHNRSHPVEVGFLTTVRIFSILLFRIAQPFRGLCQVAIAGFLRNGNPCLALVHVSPDFNRVAFRKVSVGNTLAIPVGDPHASRLLLTAMDWAHREKRSSIGAALNTLIYIAKHEGMWNSVGGALAVGSCSSGSESFEWPVIRVGSDLFLRGLNVTEQYREGWPPATSINYDEEWCARIDQETDPDRQTDLPAGGELPGFDIAIHAGMGDLLQVYDDPDFD